MLARSSIVRQVSNVVRGNKFSMLSLAEEFPVRDTYQQTANVPVIANNKLDNGIKFVSRSRDSGLVNVRFAVVGGSSTETAQQKGAAHYLATAAFTGNNESSGLRVVGLLEGLGASFSATADREKIVYDLSVLSDRVAPAVSCILSSIASPPAYHHVLEEHREVVRQWYDALNQDANLQLNELVHEAAFGDSSAFGSSLYAPNLKNLKIDDILQYRTNHFVKENLVIAADGISAEDLKALLDQHGSLPSGKAATVGKATFTGGEVKVRNNLEGTTHVAVAFGTPAGEAGKAYDVVYNALAHQLQKKKICASTFQSKYHNGGFFGIQTRGNAADIDRVVRASFDELKAIAANGSAAHARRGAVGINTFSTLDGRRGASVLLDAYLSGAEANAHADTRGVTAQQVSDAAKAILKSTPAYAVYGITSGTPSHNAISKLLA